MNRSKNARQFAIEVVQRLQDAGFEALFAGGCVRDQLLGIEPKDYDVATNARPDEIRKLFGVSRTLAIGEAFGVITVIGPKSAGQIDVATFRQDDVYSDGRHPDSVRFSTSEQDAQRRDFSINGLFFDPLANRVLDYVGGREDLIARRIRAIGDARARIAEDRLRMLRAVRFASRFEFEMEPETLEAIRESAPKINQVSRERIGNELRLMFGNRNRHLALIGLLQTGLLAQLLPERLRESAGLESKLEVVARALQRLSSDRFESALAIMVYDLPDRVGVIQRSADRWKLSNIETETVHWTAAHIDLFLEADRREWPAVQRELIQPAADETLRAAEAIAATWNLRGEGIEFCRQRLAWPQEQLNPPPLIDGHDLKSLQVPAGPLIGQILTRVRDGQLSGEISDRKQALEFARALIS